MKLTKITNFSNYKILKKKKKKNWFHNYWHPWFLILGAASPGKDCRTKPISIMFNGEHIWRD